jgi:hypothetical protein
MALPTTKPADITRRLAYIDRALASGAKSINVDGHATAIDTDSLRAERDRLLDELEQTLGTRRKPVVATINLRGVF